MTAEQAVRLVEITQRKADELFEELIAELRGATVVRSGAGEIVTSVAASDPTASTGGQDDEPWTHVGPLPAGRWDEIGREAGVTYTWPDGNLDRYTEFVRYRGTGGLDGLTLALGYLENGDVVGFVLGTGGSKRGITYFFPTDDFAQSNEKISMIRGGGARGRGGFGPADAVPPAYHGFKTEPLRDRVRGKWNVLGVVAEADDYETMLAHTALQAKLRRLA